MRVIVDDREKASEVPYELEKFGVNINYEHLEVGDYIPLPELVVERKSLRDLVKSIYDGRLFTQCSEMIKHYERALMIVEYDRLLDEVIDNPLIVYGALISIILEFNISIINSYSTRDTALILFSLANRKGKESKPMLKKIKKSNSIKNQQLTLIASLPTIGGKLAEKLLDKFGSPYAIMNANTNELANVIGYARAKKVRNIIDTIYKEKEEIFDKHWFE